MATKFLYMDEQYIDHRTYRDTHGPKRRNLVSLTGVLIPTDIHRTFRSRYYKAVTDALGVKDQIIPTVPDLHAVNLFPGHHDDVKLKFLEVLVSICVDLQFRIFRVGYYETPEALALYRDRKSLLGLSFLGILLALQDDLAQNEIWPVMETDNSTKQDLMFAAQIQNIDYLTSIVGSRSMSVDNGNLGELHYSTKRSAYGVLTDCVSYLLDAKFLQKTGFVISPFKLKLANIAEQLEPLTTFNEIIELQIGSPPAAYLATGPARYAVPIVPTDPSQD